MIVYDNIKKQYCIINQQNSKKTYYHNIVHKKYSLGLNKSCINYATMIRNKIDTLYK